MTTPQQPRHFVDLWRLEPSVVRLLLDEAIARKARRAGRPTGWVDEDAPAAGRSLAMVFQKNSTRTRFSFDAAIRQLGGASVIATSADMQLGRGETIEDTARVLSRMVDAVMIRANNHDDVERFAQVATVPVINGLTDRSHPCQILADLMTFEEHRGRVEGRTFAWVGDGNNVCASFIHAAALFGFKLNIACPPQYHPDLMDLAKAAERGGQVEMTDDPRAAVRGADCVVTDTWVSMGQESEYEERIAPFLPYAVDDAALARAAGDAVVLHCLPAYRGKEIDADVIDGPASAVWDEAENRLHAQKALLVWLLEHG